MSETERLNLLEERVARLTQDVERMQRINNSNICGLFNLIRRIFGNMK